MIRTFRHADAQRKVTRRYRYGLSLEWETFMAYRRFVWRYRPINAWRRERWRRQETWRRQAERVAWLKRTAWIRSAGWLLDGGSYPVSGPQR